ncbi:hypothetical protein BCR34DRAFT_126482 [Clohesyomyces aquaticus]|uniref:Homeobox domain-containing protein n=1 Tax=Clohesyomyces aquaticus TaxID=1231657 RepID=A0A1Y1YN81_9PLEO|nr:hypothetical protein BCR34DRAFT_126482 [Clohesyomyces aquaticus]
MDFQPDDPSALPANLRFDMDNSAFLPDMDLSNDFIGQDYDNWLESFNQDLPSAAWKWDPLPPLGSNDQFVENTNYGAIGQTDPPGIFQQDIASHAMFWDDLPSSDAPPSHGYQPNAAMDNAIPVDSLDTIDLLATNHTFESGVDGQATEVPAEDPGQTELIPKKSKAKRPRIASEAREILESKFAINPYPSPFEMDNIVREANLDPKKVRNWFNNARARRNPPGRSGQETRHDDCSSAKTSQPKRLSQENLEKLLATQDFSYKAPMEAFLSSRPPLRPNTAPYVTPIFPGFDSPPGHPASIASIPASRASSGGRSGSSYGSNVSGRSRRRGLRRMGWRTSPYPTPEGPITIYQLPRLFSNPGEPEPKYQPARFFCTFCYKTFARKFEWLRHEESVHVLPKTWTCCLTGLDNTSSCPFCGMLAPSEQHLESHGYRQCMNQPEKERTFYRRDHFVAHLHRVHFDCPHPDDLLGCHKVLEDYDHNLYGCAGLAVMWHRNRIAYLSLDDPLLQCHFCGERMENWPDRCNHVAKHFLHRYMDPEEWWEERLESRPSHAERWKPVLPNIFRCRFCNAVCLSNLGLMHICEIWSCRFLDSFRACINISGLPMKFDCALCDEKGLCGDPYAHGEDAHGYRECGQALFDTADSFIQHLREEHRANGSNLPDVIDKFRCRGDRPPGPNIATTPSPAKPSSESIIHPFTSQNHHFSVQSLPQQVPHAELDPTSPKIPANPNTLRMSSDSYIHPSPSQSGHICAQSLPQQQDPQVWLPVSRNDKPPKAEIAGLVSERDNDKLHGPGFFLSYSHLSKAYSWYHLRRGVSLLRRNFPNETYTAIPMQHIGTLVVASAMLGLSTARWCTGVNDTGEVDGVVRFTISESG